MSFMVDFEPLVLSMSVMSMSESIGSEGPCDDLPKMRHPVKLYSPGDAVEFYSARHNRWMLDAEVTEMLPETAQRDGVKIRAGSMKVVYAGGARFHWVAPQQMNELLRPSRRPRDPDCMTGELQLFDEAGWLFHWLAQHVAVRKGTLRWWDSKENAESGQAENGFVHLQGIEPRAEGVILKLLKEGTEEVVHCFAADSAAEARMWSTSLASHCSYATAMKQHNMQQQLRSSGSSYLRPLSPIASGSHTSSCLSVWSRSTASSGSTLSSRSGSPASRSSSRESSSVRSASSTCIAR